MKKSTKRLFALGAFVFLLIALPLSMHYCAKAHFEAYKRELFASGEKLDISDIAPTPDAEGQKNAAALLQAANRLTSIIDFYPYGMKLIKPGRARVAWRQSELNQEVYPPGMFTNVWPLLRVARTHDEDALAEIRGILSAGKIQFPIDFQLDDIFPSVVGHFMTGKKLAWNANAEVMLDLRDGRTNEAMENLLLCVEVPKLCGNEPLMISQLVRYAEEAIAVPSCWEALQFKGWTDGQLAELQSQWECLDFLSAAANSIAMERAQSPMFFDTARGSKENLGKMTWLSNPSAGLNEIWRQTLKDPREGFGQLMQMGASYPRYWLWRWIWSYDDERLNMQLYQEMIDSTRFAQKRQAVLERLKDADVEISEMNSRFPVTDYERPHGERFVVITLRAQTQVEIVTAAIALERYFLRNQKYPERLDDLVPMFVKRVPIDYMDGKDLRYHRQPNGSYLLYSIGKNGIDDGGDPTPLADKSPGFLNGRDWVWPGIATEEEVSAYEAGEARKAAQKQAKPGKLRNQ